jgi:hypothetical protein
MKRLILSLMIATALLVPTTPASTAYGRPRGGVSINLGNGGGVGVYYGRPYYGGQAYGYGYGYPRYGGYYYPRQYYYTYPSQQYYWNGGYYYPQGGYYAPYQWYY